MTWRCTTFTAPCARYITPIQHWYSNKCPFLADHTNGCTYSTRFCLSVVCLSVSLYVLWLNGTLWQWRQHVKVRTWQRTHFHCEYIQHNYPNPNHNPTPWQYLTKMVYLSADRYQFKYQPHDSDPTRVEPRISRSQIQRPSRWTNKPFVV